MDIAVVDDEKAIREHICVLIEEQKPGSRIEAYSTGEELLASGKRFDIVFLDIQMDGMNGIEAARNLRQQNAMHGVEDTCGSAGKGGRGGKEKEGKEMPLYQDKEPYA